MTDAVRLRPGREAARITKMLDAVLGVDRFDRGPVDIVALALEYSRSTAPDTPIHEVVDQNLPGCVGALVYGETLPRQWAIMVDKGQSRGRRAFTVGHEFGHWILHRTLIEGDSAYEGGIYCDENSVVRREGSGIEKEADEFAAALLMPLHDFRKQLPPDQRPDLKTLANLASRYGVSLTAAILRWLEYTDTRAMMIVSSEGFAHWARSSNSAFRCGRFIRTKNTVFELPQEAFAVRRDFSEAAILGIQRPANVWFPEPAIEMCRRSERYDQEITLIHFQKEPPCFDTEERVPDVYDRFIESGQHPVR